MKNNKKILIVDDELGARESLRVILDSEYKIDVCSNYDEAFSALTKTSYNLILLDICMPVKSGLDLLKDLRKKNIDTPVIMVTATKTLKTAITAMKYGASDYITKPYDVEEIRILVRENIQETPSKIETISTTFNVKNIIGYNTTLKDIFKLVNKLATTDSTVLILGESGTGKEVIANAIHRTSQRKNKNFIPIHLSAISENLIESELFGHSKGSFTGADRDRIGAFELGNEGTIFLDEIGEIKESVQIKLLRVLQEKEFKSVGDNKIKKTDVRVIAATNKDLYKLVEEGRFRADLYYRLNVVPINLPLLKERIKDIPELTDFLSAKICTRIHINTIKIDPQVINAFIKYSWPGNIRELENTLEHMIILAENNLLTKDLLPFNIIKEYKTSDTSMLNNFNESKNENMLNSLEKETIQVALLRNNGVLTSTAKYLGTTRRILKYKMDKLRISKEDVFKN